MWHDIEGSTVCGKMSGGTDDKMGEALEKSAFVIVCISNAYSTRPNCEQEAKYARALEKEMKLTIIYVMMQSDFTMVSQPEHVEGWLAMYVGDKLWYPLWDRAQVESTGSGNGRVNLTPFSSIQFDHSLTNPVLKPNHFVAYLVFQATTSLM